MKTNENKNSLNEEEKKQLADLLSRINNTQIKGEIWHQLVQKFITVSAVFCVLDEEKVFLTYRKDREFDGYHLPGVTVNDWETVDQARERLVKGEVEAEAGLKVSEPEPIGWVEVERGVDDNPTRHAIILLYITRIQNVPSLKEGAGFYPLDNLPENILGCEKRLLSFFARYLEDGLIILGR